MLDAARRKAAEGGFDIDYRLGDIREVRLGERFDAVVAMFAVMGYQTGNDDVSAAIRIAREHLEPGGLFIFDVWFGPAVLHVKPSDRVIVIEDGDETIVRETKSELNFMDHTVDVNFTIIKKKGNSAVRELSETHTMRFFFPKELEYLLSNSGFELVGIFPFGDLNGKSTMSTWNVSVIARAV